MEHAAVGWLGAVGHVWLPLGGLVPLGMCGCRWVVEGAGHVLLLSTCCASALPLVPWGMCGRRPLALCVLVCVYVIGCREACAAAELLLL